MTNSSVNHTRTIDKLLSEYGESHQNATNKIIHWICVPAIMFSLLGIFYTIPFPGGIALLTNWAVVLVGLTLIYYLTLSFPIFLGFIVVGGAMALGNHFLAQAIAPFGIPYVFVCLGIFVLAWIGQLGGQKSEGKKPSWLKDLQGRLGGPAGRGQVVGKQSGRKY